MSLLAGTPGHFAQIFISHSYSSMQGCTSTTARYLLLQTNKLVPSPRKLFLFQFLWALPYLLLSNYLERSLLPLRLLCYTQSDLLSSKPLHYNFDICLRKFFRDNSVHPDCHVASQPRVSIRPQLPDQPKRILVIRTGPGSIDYRSFIRQTWKPKVDPYAPVVFVCAKSGTDVIEEAEQYKDILQFEFADSYHNLSWKMMAIYGFVLSELPSVEEIIVTNDDTIVNITALRTISLMYSSSDPWMLGKVSRGYPRLFMPWLPWHVPGTMYSNLCYPRFTQGSSFILSREGARMLLNNVCKVPFVHLDDVFMGIISNCLPVQQLHHHGFDKHEFEDFVVYHYQYSRHSAQHLKNLWESSKDLF